jgi:hypothetical protein
MTAYLFRSFEIANQVEVIVEKLAPALEEAGTSELLDLCSGGAGPMPLVVEALRQRGVEVHATLTDLFPNVAFFERAAKASGGCIDFIAEPVDATAVSPTIPGFRTIFNAFHHLRPAEARRVLASAVEARRPIAVVEMVGREPATILSMPFAVIAVLLLMPTIRPLHWSWLLFTYLIPLIPLLVAFDGFVSCLRVYSVRELEGLVSKIDFDPERYRFEFGRVRIGKFPVHATYLIGMPTEAHGG